MAENIIFTPEELASEEWRHIPGYLDAEASNLGKIKYKGALKAFTLSRRYLICSLKEVGGAWRSSSVHRLVMLAFNGPSQLTVDHLDGNTLNNKLSNLEYVSLNENLVRRFVKQRGGEFLGSIWYDPKRRSPWRIKIDQAGDGNFKTFSYKTVEEAKEAMEDSRNTKREIIADFTQDDYRHCLATVRAKRRELRKYLSFTDIDRIEAALARCIGGKTKQ